MHLPRPVSTCPKVQPHIHTPLIFLFITGRFRSFFILFLNNFKTPEIYSDPYFGCNQFAPFLLGQHATLLSMQQTEDYFNEKYSIYKDLNPKKNNEGSISGLLIFRAVAEPRISSKSAKFRKTREIPRNSVEILPNTCRHNIFESYLGYWGCLFAVNLLIYLETSSPQRVNNTPKIPGILRLM